MKILGFILLLTTIVACDPFNFGFKKNPAYVLDEAFKAISNLDDSTLREVTGREAFCVYGNKEGIAYLKEKISISTEQVELVPTVLETKHFAIPKFMGYWSYYHARYVVDIRQKDTKELLMQTIVDCDYGTEAEKDDSLINLDPDQYEKKECRTIKLIPKKFSALPIPEKCNALKVDL